MTPVATHLEREAAERGPRAQREHERQAVAAHYENHPEIFSLVLDRRLAYATGIFEAEGEDLETAQARKYAWIRDHLAILSGEQVLDVGCGWGSNLLYLAEQTQGVFRGVTLSGRQQEEALARARRGGLAHRVSIERAHIEDVTLAPESLDAVLFVGSIVHMHNREAVHAKIAEALRPGGRLLISDCFFPKERRGDRDSSATRYIFETALGYCRLLRLSDELALLEDCGLDVTRVLDLTASYACTLQRWIENVRASRDRIEQLSPRFSRVLQVYMTIAQLSFQRRTALEYMVVAVKGRPPRPFPAAVTP
jgi:cyclopropane-fatty-acyl-phospholipid synthase